jgi:hypothetical protein
VKLTRQQSPDAAKRAWRLHATLLIGSGIVATSQIGKAHHHRSDDPRGPGRLAPGAIYAAAPHAAPTPSAVPPTIGLVQQASNLGQFAGPVALGLCVEHLGWQAAPAILAPAALFGLASAFVLRRVLIIEEGRGSTSESAASALTKQSVVRGAET